MKTPDDNRRLAQHLREELIKIDSKLIIREEDEVAYIDASKLVPLIVGHLEAKLLDALANQAEYLQLVGFGRHPSKTQERVTTNDRLRTFAASGQWDKFDELVNSISGGSNSTGATGTGEREESVSDGST